MTPNSDFDFFGDGYYSSYGDYIDEIVGNVLDLDIGGCNDLFLKEFAINMVFESASVRISLSLN